MRNEAVAESRHDDWMEQRFSAASRAPSDAASAAEVPPGRKALGLAGLVCRPAGLLHPGLHPGISEPSFHPQLPHPLTV